MAPNTKAEAGSVLSTRVLSVRCYEDGDVAFTISDPSGDLIGELADIIISRADAERIARTIQANP